MASFSSQLLKKIIVDQKKGGWFLELYGEQSRFSFYKYAHHKNQELITQKNLSTKQFSQLKQLFNECYI